MPTPSKRFPSWPPKWRTCDHTAGAGGPPCRSPVQRATSKPLRQSWWPPADHPWPLRRPRVTSEPRGSQIIKADYPDSVVAFICLRLSRLGRYETAGRAAKFMPCPRRCRLSAVVAARRGGALAEIARTLGISESCPAAGGDRSTTRRPAPITHRRPWRQRRLVLGSRGRPRDGFTKARRRQSERVLTVALTCLPPHCRCRRRRH